MKLLKSGLASVLATVLMGMPHQAWAAEHDHQHDHTLTERRQIEQHIARAVKAKRWNVARTELQHWIKQVGQHPDRQAIIFMGLALDSPEFTQILIDEGADVNATGSGLYAGVPAIHAALGNKQYHLVKVLLKADAKLYIRDTRNKYILDYLIDAP